MDRCTSSFLSMEMGSTTVSTRLLVCMMLAGHQPWIHVNTLPKDTIARVCAYWIPIQMVFAMNLRLRVVPMIWPIIMMQKRQMRMVLVIIQQTRVRLIWMRHISPWFRQTLPSPATKRCQQRWPRRKIHVILRFK